MEDHTEIQFIIQPPFQFLAGVEFFPEEMKNGTIYKNEFSIHALLFTIKVIW